MKKRLCGIGVALLTALVMLVFAACGDKPQGGETDTPTTEPVVVSISITHAPDKTVYMAGETFDKTGMVVTAKYSDNTQKAVDDYTVDKTVLRIDDTFVTVTYKQKRATVGITVNPNTDPDALVKSEAKRS